jgi:mono/diheme cytochrome c family protein
VALAVWSGAAGERAGAKRVSAWRALRLEAGGGPLAPAAAPTPRLPGDARRGRRLMAEKGCAACHVFPGNPARPTVGPDLTYAGGIHTPGYLLDSLTQPSKVVVPGPGYFTVSDGRRTSVMPPFPGSEQELRDLVAFLRSLR